MTLTDRQEEILESLWVELVENKRKSCDSSLLKDNESLKVLVELNYVNIKDNQITLTQKGEEESRSCVRRHRLAERLFVDVFDIKKTAVHEPSCRFEHLLHKGLDDNICTLLGHPKKCPHGKDIPEGPCCRDAKRLPGKVIVPLSDLDTKVRAKISYLHTHERNAMQKAIAMGALPNTEISLIQKSPSYVFQIGKSQFAIDKELASQIYVRVI